MHFKKTFTKTSRKFTEKEKVSNRYDFFKACASKYLKSGELANAAKYCEISARIAYIYNLKFSDDELESVVKQISNVIAPGILNYTPFTNRIVFYDSFASSRVLTVQYLVAIIGWQSELLFITPQKEISEEVLRLITNYPKGGILHVDSAGSFQKGVEDGLNAIMAFKPQNIFLHLTPWDICGVCIFNKITSGQRFLINLTDHSFWLGKSCSDYILEFRKYGSYISQFHRKIPAERLLLQRFYPVKTDMPFQGFPIDKGGKILAFAGSSFYKMYGRNGLFLKTIKDLLLENINVIFLIAGDGNDRPLKAFIKRHKLRERIIVIGNRSDINNVVRNIDIYVNTFPLSGGLMTQLAALNKKPIIGFANECDYGSNDIEDFLNIQTHGVLVKASVEDFKGYFKLLVESEEEREKNVCLTANCILTPTEFSNLLYKNMKFKTPIIPHLVNEILIDENAIFELHNDIESNFVMSYKWVIWNTVRTLIIKDDFLYSIKLMWWKFTSKVIGKFNKTSY